MSIPTSDLIRRLIEDIEKLALQIEDVKRDAHGPIPAREKRKLTGLTPHSGTYKMSLAARHRASGAQRDRWAKANEAREAEIAKSIPELPK